MADMIALTTKDGEYVGFAADEVSSVKEFRVPRDNTEYSVVVLKSRTSSGTSQVFVVKIGARELVAMVGGVA